MIGGECDLLATMYPYHLAKLIWTPLVAILLVANIARAQDEAPAFSPWVDNEGNISLPENFRIEWSHLGSWGLADGMHDVYAQAESIAAYKRDGKFPDGAVLVKEVRGHKAGAKTTGQAQWAGEIIQWFVMVKDSKGRFKDHPLWGDGWGWALFKPDQPKKQLAKSYQIDCMACHIPAAKTDRVYIEAYPTLQSK